MSLQAKVSLWQFVFQRHPCRLRHTPRQLKWQSMVQGEKSWKFESNLTLKAFSLREPRSKIRHQGFHPFAFGPRFPSDPLIGGIQFKLGETNCLLIIYKKIWDIYWVEDWFPMVTSSLQCIKVKCVVWKYFYDMREILWKSTCKRRVFHP